MTEPAVARILSHLLRLTDKKTPRSQRLALWRLIIGAAHEAHTIELREGDVEAASNLNTVAEIGA